jgi:carbamate kinase
MLNRQVIRVLVDANLNQVVAGGGGVAVKQTQAGATCGDCITPE